MSRTESDLVWDRPQPAPRPPPVALSRDAIVQAALATADEQGLASVTFRGVAAALGAGPMRLYGYLSTKEELLELMVDAVYAEILAGQPAVGPWRQAVAHLARSVRAAALRHPWFAALLGGRPHQGPNALAYLEALLAALAQAPCFEDIDGVFQAAKTVNAYVLGALGDEMAEGLARRESGLSKEDWQASRWPYLERQLATGRFPTIAAVVREARHPSPDAVFEAGLDCVLDGVALAGKSRR